MGLVEGVYVPGEGAADEGEAPGEGGGGVGSGVGVVSQGVVIEVVDYRDGGVYDGLP